MKAWIGWSFALGLGATALVNACSESEAKGDEGSGGSDAGGASGSGGSDAGGASGNQPERPARPNFLVILADDFGFDDRGIKNPELDTPRLDELAEQSVRFENFYTQPVCATTRAALLTGQQPNAVGVWDVHGGRDFLSLHEELLVERLHEDGYRTGVFGKWHSGFSGPYQPHHRGFDEAYTAHLYDNFNNSMLHNGQPFPTDGWTTEVLADLTMEFMDESAAGDERFVAYVPFLAPHEPWEAPEEFIQPYRDDGKSEALASVYGMISHLDHHIGRLIEHVENADYGDDTVIFFMSDNGPWKTSYNPDLELDAFDWRERNPSGLARNKGEVEENGIRSPLYVRFGPHFEAGESEALLGVQDVFPTMLELAGVDSPSGLDGASFLPALEGSAPDERELFFQKHSVRVAGAGFGGATGIADNVSYGLTPDKSQIAFEDQILAYRKGDWKLLRDYGGSLALHNISIDPQERDDLADEEPTLLKELETAMLNAFESLTNDEDSFSPGVEHIGFNGVSSSSVSARTAMDRSRTVGVKSWRAENFNEPDDYIEMRVAVDSGGQWAVDTVLWMNNFSGGEVSVSVEDQTVTAALSADSAESLGGNKYRLPLGSLTLSEGTHQLRFSLSKVGTDTSKRPHLEGLEQLVFERL